MKSEHHYPLVLASLALLFGWGISLSSVVSMSLCAAVAVITYGFIKVLNELKRKMDKVETLIEETNDTVKEAKKSIRKMNKTLPQIQQTLSEVQIAAKTINKKTLPQVNDAVKSTKNAVKGLNQTFDSGISYVSLPAWGQSIRSALGFTTRNVTIEKPAAVIIAKPRK